MFYQPDPGTTIHTSAAPNAARHRGYSTTATTGRNDERARTAVIFRQPSMPFLRSHMPVLVQDSYETLKGNSAKAVEPNALCSDSATNLPASDYTARRMAVTQQRYAADVENAAAQSLRRVLDVPGLAAPQHQNPPYNTLRARPSMKTLTARPPSPVLRQQSSTHTVRKMSSRPLRAQISKASLFSDKFPLPMLASPARTTDPAPDPPSCPPEAFFTKRTMESNPIASTTLTDSSTLSGASMVAEAHGPLFKTHNEESARAEHQDRTLNRLTALTDFTDASTGSTLSGASVVAAIHADLFHGTVKAWPLPPKQSEDAGNDQRRQGVPPGSPPSGCADLHSPYSSASDCASSMPASAECDLLRLLQIVPRRPSNASIAGFRSFLMLSDDEDEDDGVVAERRPSDASVGVVSVVLDSFRALQSATEQAIAWHPQPPIGLVLPTPAETPMLEPTRDEDAGIRCGSQTPSSISDTSDSERSEEVLSVSELSVNSHSGSTASSVSGEGRDGASTVLPSPSDEATSRKEQFTEQRPQREVAPVQHVTASTQQDLPNRYATNFSAGSCDTLQILGVKYSGSNLVVECEILTILNYLTEVKVSNESRVVPVILNNQAVSLTNIERFESHLDGKDWDVVKPAEELFEASNSFRHSVIQPWFWWTLRLLVPVNELLDWIEELWAHACPARRARLGSQLVQWVGTAWRPQWDEPHAERLSAFVNDVVRVESKGMADTIVGRLAESRRFPPRWPSRVLSILHGNDGIDTLPCEFPFSRNILGYASCSLGVKVFAEHLTLLFSDKFREINPWALVLAYHDVGDTKIDLEKTWRALYTGASGWVKSTILAVNGEMHVGMRAFWLKVGHILYNEHHNFHGATAIAEGITSAERHSSASRHKRFSKYRKLPNKLRKMRKVHPDPVDAEWVQEAMRLVTTQWPDYNKMIGSISSRPFIPLNGAHKGLTAKLEKRGLIRQWDGDIIINLSELRQLANIIEPYQLAHRRYLFDCDKKICQWLEHNVLENAEPDVEGLSSTYFGLHL